MDAAPHDTTAIVALLTAHCNRRYLTFVTVPRSSRRPHSALLARAKHQPNWALDPLGPCSPILSPPAAQQTGSSPPLAVLSLVSPRHHGTHSTSDALHSFTNSLSPETRPAARLGVTLRPSRPLQRAPPISQTTSLPSSNVVHTLQCARR